MKNRIFKGSQQQDAQEFLRCLLSQVHEELAIQVPQLEGDRACAYRDSMVSCDSDTSAESHSSQSRLVGSARNSPVTKKRSSSSSSLSRVIKLPGSAHNSPSSQKYTKIMSSSAKNSVESIPSHVPATGSRVSLEHREKEGVVEWAERDVFLADIIEGKVTAYRNYLSLRPSSSIDGLSSHDHESANPITSLVPSLSERGSASDGDLRTAGNGSPSRDATPTSGDTPTVQVKSAGRTSQRSSNKDERNKHDSASVTNGQIRTEIEAPPTKAEAPPTKSRAGECSVNVC